MTRWMIFLGRGGTVLISMGIALLLVSLLPPAQQTIFVPPIDVPPKKVSLLSNLQLYSSIDHEPQSYEILLTPQEGLQIELYANGSIDVYILEVSLQVLYQWVDDDFLSVTDLEEFLEANPSVIGWYDEFRNGHNEHTEHEYVPTKVTNATLVFSNPSSEYVKVNCHVDLISHEAGFKVRNLGQWVIPIGFVLFLPWFTQMWKRKTRRS